MSTRTDLAGRRALVTGATGMVGSALVHDLLASGTYVAALVLDADPQTELYRSGDVDRVAVVSGALEDLAALERGIRLHEVDTVFHLGAQTLVGSAHHAPLYTFEANIRGTYNLLEACRRHSDLVRCVIMASSDKAYGAQSLPYTEGQPLLGRHPYEVSKSCADMLAQTYFHTYRLPVAIARCGNIYGGGDRNWSRLVPGTIRDCLQGRAPVIRSDGTCLRDYLYVQDAVSAYRLLAEAITHDGVAGEAFNFGDEAPATVLEMVGILQRLMHCEQLTPEIRNDARGEIPHQHASSEKARRILGWSPHHRRDAALTETIAWYRQYFRLDPPDAAAPGSHRG